MREIKFRVWNEVMEKMFAWNEFLNTNMKQTFIAPESTAMILMQYTGLKDKNGKEIYEGDILREYDNEIQDWIVSYEYGKFIGTWDNVCEDLYELSDLEVIGNIYDK